MEAAAAEEEDETLEVVERSNTAQVEVEKVEGQDEEVECTGFLQQEPGTLAH